MESFLQELSSISSSAHGSSHSPPSAPTNDDIEAVIQLATSSRPSLDGKPGLTKDTRTQLFVGNLPYRVRWQDLKDLFRKAGTVLRADVSLGPDNRSRGYGTVLLATAEDAGRAVDMFNGYSWQTRILEVRPDRIPAEFVTNPLNGMLAGNFTSGHGSTLASAAMTTTPYGGNPTMPMGPTPLSIHRDFDHGSFFGSECPRSTGIGGRNLFVGNLPFHCQWQDLKDLFRQAGTVVRADVAMSIDGRSRGFGTVVLASELDADRAVKMFNGYEYNGRVLKVHYDKYPQSHKNIIPASPSPPSSSLGDTTVDRSILLSYQPGHSFTSHPTNLPMHIQMPIDYPFDFGTSSGPNSPYEPYPPHHSQLQTSVSHSHSQSQAQLIDRLAISMSAVTLSTDRNPDLSSPPHSPISQSRPAPNRPPPHSQNHAHPGPIALPPPPLVTSFPPHPHSPHLTLPMSQSPLHHPMSPSHHLHHVVPMTPHGLPPITPSMPPFTFLPQFTPPAYNSNHGHSATTPTSASNPNSLHPHSRLVSPFSPALTMSPGAFWGRPGGGLNPFINPAVGAPVHNENEFPDAGMGAASNTHMSPGSESVRLRNEPVGYFPPVPHTPNQDTGYFPPMMFASEILGERQESSEKQDGWIGETHKDAVESTTPSETDIETGERASCSVATSWHTCHDIETWVSDVNGTERHHGVPDKGARNGETSFDGGVEDDSNDRQAHSRTHSLSPSSKKPVLVHRSDSDPVIPPAKNDDTVSNPPWEFSTPHG